MREFVYGNDQQYALLKESLNDHMCHVYGHCTFPSSFSKNAGRIGFEKEGDTYALFMIRVLLGSKSNTSQLFRDWLSVGTTSIFGFY